MNPAQGIKSPRVPAGCVRYLQPTELRALAAGCPEWLRMSGAVIHTVAQLLGHRDLRMAARYQHLSPAFLASAVGKLDAVFGDLSGRTPEQLTPTPQGPLSAASGVQQIKVTAALPLMADYRARTQGLTGI